MTVKTNSTRILAFALSMLLVLTIFIENIALSVVVVAMILIVGLLDPKELIPSFLIVSMAGDTFTSFQGFGYPRVFAVVFILATVLQIIKGMKIKIRHAFLLLLVCAFCFVSYSHALTDSLVNLMTILLNIAVVICVSNINMTKSDKHEILEVFIMHACLFVLLYGLVLLFDPYVRYFTSKTCYVISDKNNPNTYAQMLAQLGVAIFGMCLLKRQSKEKRTFLWIVIIILVACLYLSKSIAGTYALIFGGAITFFVFSFGTGSKTKVLARIAGIVIASAVVLGVIVSIVPDIFSGLGFVNAIQSGGNGRMQYILTEINEIIPRNLWFGVGIGTDNEVAALNHYYSFTTMSSTNILFSMLTQVGITGSFAFIFLFIRTLKSGIKGLTNENYLIIPIAMFITALFNGIGEVVFFERYLWNSIALIFLLLTESSYSEDGGIRL